MENQIWFHKYRIIKKLGQGGSAQVYLCEHVKLKALRAIKQISKDNILHEQLLKEAYILKNLKHSCIPIIYDFEEDAHNSYIIEQYIEGESLKVYRQQFEHISEEIIIDFTNQICDLLQYLYSFANPILYLDLKPENIIISENVIKLIDFGASVSKEGIASRKYSMGTIGYAAPELFGRKAPDERTDVYGIGALLYFMMNGTSFIPPLNKKNLEGIGLPYSKSLIRITEKCIHSYPPFRYSSVAALKSKLSELKKRKAHILCHKYINSSKSICIAAAGTQHRVGTTHLSFLLTSYFTEAGQKTLYIEKNKSNHIKTILKRYQNLTSKNGIYQVSHCNLLPFYQIELPYDLADYPITIMDYGCLNQDNLEDFLKADIKMIISGSKDWEMDEALRVFLLLSEVKDINYLFNYSDGKQFQQIKNLLDHLNCYRIPYIPNPFEIKGNNYIKEFIQKIMD